MNSLIVLIFFLFGLNCILLTNSEFAKHSDVDENVAVIVCGLQTKVHRYYSNNYDDIKHSLGLFCSFYEILLHMLLVNSFLIICVYVTNG